MTDKNRPSLSMPVDQTILEPLGRAQWAAMRLQHYVRDLIGVLEGQVTDVPIKEKTLGQAICLLKQTATTIPRQDVLDWCKDSGEPARDRRNGLMHALGFTASDGKQAIGSHKDGCFCIKVRKLS